MAESMLSQTRRMRDTVEKRKRRAYQANQQPVVAGGPGSGRAARTGAVTTNDVRNMRRQLNDAVAAKDAKKLAAVAASAQRWLNRGESATDKKEVSNILQAANRLAKKYGPSNG